MTGTNSNTERLYSLLSDLSPELLADAFPEGTGTAAALPFSTKRQHIRRIGRAIAIYAACIVVLVGAVIYLPKLIRSLSEDYPPITSITSPPPTPTIVDGWDISKLEEVTDDSVLDCISSRLNSNSILQSNYPATENWIENMVIEYYFRENTCSEHEIHSFAYTDWQELQVYLDGKWYRVPTLIDLPETSKDTLSLEDRIYQRNFRIDEQLYGLLPGGNYRAVHAFSVGSESGVVYTPFRIIAPTIDYYLNTDGSWNQSLLEGIDLPEYPITDDCIEGEAIPSAVDLTADRKVAIRFTARHECESTASNAYYDHRLSISSIDPPVQLEVEINGVWYAVPMLSGGHTYRVSGTEQLVNIGDSLQVEFPLTEKAFGDLPAGNYRISAEFEVSHHESIRDRESYNGIIYVPFTIVSANAAPPATPDEPVLIPESASKGLKYVLQNDGTYAVYAGDCTDTQVVIPSSCNGIPVTAIGDSAFANRDQITSVTLPDTVTSIGNVAFEWCTSLQSVNIPASVTTIGDGAFMVCSSLQSLELPSDLSRIASYAIYGCSSLTEFVIPEGVTVIGEYAFANCEGLTEITIPASVITIEREAFVGSYRLGSIIFEDPNGWTCEGTPMDLSDSAQTIEWFMYSAQRLEKS